MWTCWLRPCLGLGGSKSQPVEAVWAVSSPLFSSAFIFFWIRVLRGLIVTCMKQLISLAGLASFLMLWASIVDAHSGGLNSEGCHNDRKRGTYHCHRRTSTQTPPAQPQRATTSGGSSYRNCAAARAAGAAPIRRGEPGYGRHLDRDNDGIACE